LVVLDSTRPQNTFAFKSESIKY